MSMAFVLAGLFAAALCLFTALRQMISRDYRAQKPRRPFVWMGLSILLFAGAAATSDPDTGPEVSDAECRADLQCWGDRHAMRAALRCAPAVEDLARFRAEWTDGVLDPKFPRFAWADRDAATVNYFGNSVMFENGFGAMRTMSYACTYDPATDTALSADAQPE